MGPVRQNPIQRTVRTAHLSVLMTVHNFSTNTAQNSSDNLPSYLQTTIIAQMLSNGGEGGDSETRASDRVRLRHMYKVHRTKRSCVVVTECHQTTTMLNWLTGNLLC